MVRRSSLTGRCAKESDELPPPDGCMRMRAAFAFPTRLCPNRGPTHATGKNRQIQASAEAHSRIGLSAKKRLCFEQFYNSRED